MSHDISTHDIHLSTDAWKRLKQLIKTDYTHDTDFGNPSDIFTYLDQILGASVSFNHSVRELSGQYQDRYQIVLTFTQHSNLTVFILKYL
jgi:hypothetical protein